jgi:hypothetical protein
MMVVSFILRSFLSLFLQLLEIMLIPDLDEEGGGDADQRSEHLVPSYFKPVFIWHFSRTRPSQCQSADPHTGRIGTRSKGCIAKCRG